MQDLFHRSEVLDTDIYLADYSNEKKNGGVEISTTPFSDIHSFSLLNPAGISCLAVNIEAYPAFKKGIENCEAFFCPQAFSSDSRKWVLLAELKYCDEKKIDEYGPKAINQMDAVRKKLMDLNKITRENHIVHFNYCAPEHAEAEPFDGFKDTQNGALSRVENDGVIFHARMKLMIVDEELLIEPDVDI